MERIIDSYYINGAQKLKSLVNKVVNNNFGGCHTKEDMNDFYSIANEVITDIWKFNRYDDSKGNFDTFLYGALAKAFIDDHKFNNRLKRKNIKRIVNNNGKYEDIVIPDVSIDSPINEDGITIGDTIKSDFNVESIIESRFDCTYSDEMITYLKSLSKTQQKILFMKADGIPIGDIKKKLGLTNKEYEQHCNDLKSFEKINLLKSKMCKKSNSNVRKLKEDKKMETTQTMEKSKTGKLNITSIIKKMDKKTILFDHPLQRESNQWSPSMRGNLISDILQENPIPPLVFAEQVVNGSAIIWDLDGKQRCTNVYSFCNNGFKVSKNIRRYMIDYQVIQKDENGQVLLDENNLPQIENRSFDIRGKKFSDLPEELQDKLNDYTFDYVQYLNCSDTDIAYHIERYNEGKPMSVPQKGIIKLGEEYAKTVKAISSLPFFRDIGGYKVSEFRNGTINRVIIESIMAINFIDSWKKKQEDLCDYLRENADFSDFEYFEDIIRRLEKVVTDEVANMFDSKNSFLFFAMFDKFSKLESDDNKFIEFMTELSRSLHSKIVDGVSFDLLSEKSTKDKTVVTGKLLHLEKLLYEFLGVNNKSNESNSNENNEDDLTFVRENVDTDITEDDMMLYEDCISDITLEVDNNTKLLDQCNRKSLIAMMAYSIVTDKDEYMNEWVKSFFAKCSDYIRNQKENYLYMKKDFDNYVAACA